MARSDTELTKRTHRIAAGTAQGALAWGAYALVEQTLSVWWPRLNGWDVVLTGAEWGSVLTVLGLFLVIGALVGFLAIGACEVAASAGLPPRAATGVRIRALAGATVTLAFVVHLALVRPMGNAELLDLAVGLTLAGALAVLVCERGERWAGPLGFLASPFVVALLLVAGGWTGRHLMARTTRLLQLAGAVAAVVVVGVGAAVFAILTRRIAPNRSRFRPLRTAVAFVVVGLLGLGSAALSGGRRVAAPLASGRTPSGAPNVVLIVMDTVRADHTSVGGYPRDTAPFLASLAHNATVYTSAVAPGDMTLSSHASLFTGDYPSWHGAHLAPPAFPLGRPLGGSLPTLAGILASHGYVTMAVVANYGYLGRGFGLDRGFAVYDVRRRAIANDRAFLRSGVLKLIPVPGVSDELDVTFARAQAVNESAFTLLRDAARNPPPFFLFVNYMDAHEPYVPPPPFDTMFPGRDPSFHHDDYLTLVGQVMSGSRAISPAEHAHLVSQYDGGIRYIDAQISALASRLRRLGVWERTLFIVTSDHGESFGERGLVGHGTSVGQDQVHVPLVIKFPGRTDPERVDRSVSLVDILPSVLRAAGIETPGNVQGRALQGLDAGPLSPVFSESFAHSGYGGRFERIERAIVDGGMKLVVSTRGTRELYDLSADPGEKHDLFRPDDPRAQGLLTSLDRWVRAIPRPAEDLPRLDRETIRRLRALGYVN